MIRENINLSGTVIIKVGEVDTPIANMYATLNIQNGSCSISTEVIDKELCLSNTELLSTEYAELKARVTERLTSVGMPVIL